MSVTGDVAKAVLIPHGKSHPFAQRECILKEPAKVGRSLAKTKIQANNFIFDCRVLSRNHALIWFQDNKVVLNVLCGRVFIQELLILFNVHYMFVVFYSRHKE